jgi:hypothetical protein
MTHRTHTFSRLSRRHLAGRPAQKPTTSATIPSQAGDPLNEEIDALASSIVHHAQDDPMLGDFTYPASLLRSIVTRVGQVIPDVVALALRQHEDYLVLREYRLPLTRTAFEVIKNNQITLDIELRSDTPISGTFDADRIIVERRTRHATLLECVRGSVALSGPRAKGLVQKVRAAALSARSALEADGHRINVVSGTVFDRYGRSGHEPAMSVRAGEIDDFLGLPVIQYLDRLDQRIREELLRVMEPATDGTPEQAPHLDSEPAEFPRGDAVGEQRREMTAGSELERSGRRPPIDISRSIGPAEWRRMLGAAAVRESGSSPWH